MLHIINLYVLIFFISFLWVTPVRLPAQTQAFDYYVFSLSWSPEYCAGVGATRGEDQCSSGRRYGFVVHGLWPQYERGYPSDCVSTETLSKRTIERLLPLMPSRGLIRHQWRKHGACSGLGSDVYFTKVEKAYRHIQIPERYRSPNRPVVVSPQTLKEEWLAANPSIPDSGIAVVCRGSYISEVRLCLSPTLEARSCGVDVRDTCRRSTVILRPVR